MRSRLPRKLKTKLRIDSGFTIIEILVVFTVVSILAGIGIASFASYSRSQQVIQSASNIKLIINEARFNSLNVVKSAVNDQGQTISCASASLLGYTIDAISPDRIVLTQICDEVSPPNRTIKTLTLPDNVEITSAIPATDCSRILFNSLSSTAQGIPCSIEITGYGQVKTVVVDAAGNASVN